MSKCASEGLSSTSKTRRTGRAELEKGVITAIEFCVNLDHGAGEFNRSPKKSRLLCPTRSTPAKKCAGAEPNGLTPALFPPERKQGHSKARKGQAPFPFFLSAARMGAPATTRFKPRAIALSHLNSMNRSHLPAPERARPQRAPSLKIKSGSPPNLPAAEGRGGEGISSGRAE